MKADQVFEATPGTVTLLYCDEDDFEEMVDSVAAAVPRAIRERASLNASPLISMEICPDEPPNSFHDLATLCARLITAAGKRSHFEGVLLLNISGLLARPNDFDRLRALGEVLAMEDGIASRCSTVIYGPVDEKQVLLAATGLDFNCQLRVSHYEPEDRPLSLPELLRDAHLNAASDAAAQLLQSAIDEMREEPNFDPRRFVQSCRPRNGVITEDSVHATLNDPFSYINRLKKIRNFPVEPQELIAERRIGFNNEH